MEVNPSKSKSKDQIQSKKKKKSKEVKEKHENVMKDLALTAYQCPNHEGQFLRILNKGQKKNGATCKSCGVKIEGKTGYLCCPKSNACYQLCSGCRVCLKNHVLRNIISVKHLEGDDLFKDNKFTCNGCKAVKIVNPIKGVSSCAVCSYFICVDCTQNSEKLWELPEDYDEN